MRNICSENDSKKSADCARIARLIQGLRARIWLEHCAEVKDQPLKAALDEAEELAWRTSYPHLFFPGLAEEKIAVTKKGYAALRDGPAIAT